MPAPTIILPKPFILVESGASIAGGATAAGGTNFGSIALVYSTCDRYSASDNILYLTEGAISIFYNSTQYFIITEDKVLNKESDAP